MTLTDSENGRIAARQTFGLNEKKILVTGASKGIGREVAIQCAAAGARLLVCGRDTSRLSDTFMSLEGHGHVAIECELTDERARQRLALECEQLDGIVHCAGIRGLSPMKMVSESFLLQVMQTNYVAPMMLTRHLLARGKVSTGASLVFMSSIAALTGTAGVGPYAGSKAALIGSVRPLALEVAKRGVRANVLCPGLVETTLITEDKTWFEESCKRYPLGIGQPGDIAHACLYFLSDASRKVTGCVFSMDGGVELP